MTLALLLDVEAIRRLIVRYAHLLDDGEYDVWGELFTEDATFCSVPGTHVQEGQEVATIVGRDAIVEAVAAVQQELRTRGPVLHFGGNPLIDVDGATAHARWDFVVIHALPDANQIAFSGRYHATFRRNDLQGWRFVRRVSCATGHRMPVAFSTDQRAV